MSELNLDTKLNVKEIKLKLDDLYIKKYDAQRVLNADQDYISLKTYNNLYANVLDIEIEIDRLKDLLNKTL
mgnify:FL=1|jgi:hypothetical protein|tara:strand:- start:393 stop:605 length:213 start_codon:yes stop_codon:yes gene_type:complete